MCVALIVYFVMLGRIALAFITSGSPPRSGWASRCWSCRSSALWAMVATLRAGFAHQRLARLAANEGMELDVSDLPEMPSGRIQRDAADALFETVRDELDDDPDNWRALVPAGPGV